MFGISNSSVRFVVNPWESFWNCGVWGSLRWEAGLPGVSSTVCNCRLQTQVFFLFERNSAMCSTHITSLSPYSKGALGTIPFYRRRTQGWDQFNSLLKLFQALVCNYSCTQGLLASKTWLFTALGFCYVPSAVCSWQDWRDECVHPLYSGLLLLLIW